MMQSAGYLILLGSFFLGGGYALGQASSNETQITEVGVKGELPVKKAKEPRLSDVDYYLEWLAEHQTTEGYWMPPLEHDSLDNRCTVTSVALLAFTGAGHALKIGPYKKIFNSLCIG